MFKQYVINMQNSNIFRIYCFKKKMCDKVSFHVQNTEFCFRILLE